MKREKADNYKGSNKKIGEKERIRVYKKNREKKKRELEEKGKITKKQ